MIRLFTKWALDPALVLAIILLSLFGIAMIYSAGVVYIPDPVTQHAWLRQSVWFGLALVAFTVLARVPLRWIEWVAVPSYVLSLLLLAATLVIGTGAGTAAGVKSWIRLGPIGFQPSEIAKIATILVLARLLSQRTDAPTSLKDILGPAAIVAAPLGLVMLQPDLGTAMAFVGILFAMLFWAGTPAAILLLVASPVVGLVLSFDTMVWSVYILGVLAFLYFYRYRLFLFESVAVVLANLAAGTIARPLWNSLKAYQQNRILVFLNPEVDPRGAGYPEALQLPPRAAHGFHLQRRGRGAGLRRHAARDPGVHVRPLAPRQAGPGLTGSLCRPGAVGYLRCLARPYLRQYRHDRRAHADRRNTPSVHQLRRDIPVDVLGGGGHRGSGGRRAVTGDGRRPR